MNQNTQWENILFEFASIKSKELGSPLRLYSNGTLVLGNYDINTVPKIDTVVQLTPKLNMLFQKSNDDVDCLVLSMSNNIDDAQKNVDNDSRDKIVVFDSRINNIHKYTVANYFFVNTDLKMNKGKIAAQVSHVTRKMMTELIESNYYKEYAYQVWNQSGNTTVVLKATQEELLQLKSHPKAFHTIDAGRTQIPAGSLTVVGFRPDFLMNLPDFSSYKLM